VQVRLRPRQLDAGPRELDRRLQQLPPGQAAVRPVHGLEAERGAGHRARRLADPEHLRRLAVAAEADVDRVHLRAARPRQAEPRSRDEEVGDARRAAVRGQDERKPAGPRARERALGDPAGERGRDTGVDRVAAFLERPGTCGRGQRVARRNGPLHLCLIAVDVPLYGQPWR